MSHQKQFRLDMLTKFSQILTFSNVSSISYGEPYLGTNLDIPAAVLIPLVFDDMEGKVLFTRRASNMAYHSGEICFPGGCVDPLDKNIRSTVMREVYEEIGVKSTLIEIIGILDSYKTKTGFLITPFLGILSNSNDFTLSPSEVSEIFCVPLKYILDSSNYYSMKKTIDGIEYIYWNLNWKEYHIWGTTAGILVELNRRLSQ